MLRTETAMTEAAFPRPAFIPSLAYKDPRAALDWLERAFGFEISGVFTDSKGAIVHAEMAHDDGVVMIGGEWEGWAMSPASADGVNTQRVHVRIAKDIDGHCETARAAGATIVMGPGDAFYGDRSYVALDLEGHRWTFSQAIKDVTPADMEKASGFTFSKRP
jgi:uncharacterized glyoxalase superfamily protein PhnB